MDKKKYGTLADLNKDKSSNNDDENATKHYTGSDKSGAYTQDPNQDKFSGLQKNAAQQKNSGQLKEANDCKIVIYKNGFQVDDDPFTNLNEQQMDTFIKKLQNSQIPEELKSLQEKYKGDVQPDIQMKNEDYRPPTPPKHIAYSGQGVSLGGQSQSQAGQINLDAGKINVDESKPKTKIQIRLHSGETKQIEINVSDTVQTLYTFVQAIAPVTGSFSLIGGFPPKPLADRNISIEDADLEDSRIQQKID